MSQNHIGDLTIGKMPTMAPMYTNDVDLYPDIVKKWGLSFLINTAKTAEGRSAGSLAWAGLANTYFWIDPARNVAGVILMQLLPFVDARRWRLLRGLSAGFMPGSMRAAASARRDRKRRRDRPSSSGVTAAHSPTPPPCGQGYRMWPRSSKRKASFPSGALELEAQGSGRIGMGSGDIEGKTS
jgi:CubicO group peptidase (beta-lactamase class C family)